MPLEVHCPNPDCARVHLVKNKYAGMRGKCPDCKSWMYVPTTGQIASLPSIELPPVARAPDEPAAQEQPRPARKKSTALATQTVVEEPEPSPEPEKVKPNRRARPAPEPEEPAVAEASLEMVEEPVEEAAPQKPKKHFSWVAVLLMVLALLSLGAMVSAPFLPGPTVEGTGEVVKDIGKPGGIDITQMPLVSGVSAGVAGLIVIALLPALILRRLGFITVFFVYLAMLGTSLLLFVSLEWFTRETRNMEKVQQSINLRKQSGQSGDGTPSMGLQYPVLTGGAASACLFLLLSALFMHRRLWSKLLAFLILAFLPALAVAWVFRKQLGIDAELPFDLPY